MSLPWPVALLLVGSVGLGLLVATSIPPASVPGGQLAALAAGVGLAVGLFSRLTTA